MNLIGIFICFLISIFKFKFRNIRFDLNIVITALMVDREIKENVKKRKYIKTA